MKTNRLRPILLLAGALASGISAYAAGISYTCAANVDQAFAGTCNTLNTTIAGLYGSTFTNANASIYIQYGATGLGESTQYLNTVTYSSYLSALTAHESGANDTTAVGSLDPNANPVAPGQGVSVTSALDAALGFSGGLGIATNNSSCTPGNANCYNGIITISNSAPLFFRSGVQSASAYDFFGVVQHETNEILGTFSCLAASGGAPVSSDGCANGGNSVGAADLFRYSSAGIRSYLSTANGSPAYFSINGGVTAIAGYNNSPNGADYGDWDSTVSRIQNAFGSPGTGNLDITNDGGSEIAVLDAVGYNLQASTPEPGTISLLGSSLLTLAGFARRRCRRSN